MGECVAERSYPASEARGGTQKEPPRVRGQGRQAGGATLHPRPGAVAGSNHPASQARDGGTEEQPHVQGVVAAQAQEGLEELSHFKRQEGWR